MGKSEDFYEADEATEDIVAAFEAGEKGSTSPFLPFYQVVTPSVNTSPSSTEIPVLVGSPVLEWLTNDVSANRRSSLAQAG